MTTFIDRIVALHGKKGAPGYELLHSDNKGIADAANKVFADERASGKSALQAQAAIDRAPGVVGAAKQSITKSYNPSTGPSKAQKLANAFVMYGKPKTGVKVPSAAKANKPKKAVPAKATAKSLPGKKPSVTSYNPSVGPSDAQKKANAKVMHGTAASKPSHTVFSADTRRALASKGQALPDGGYPIRNVVDLQHAIRAAGRSGNPSRFAQVKAHIKKRAKALNKEALVPDGW